MSDYSSYYEMMGTSEDEENASRFAAEELGWKENTHMEGFNNPRLAIEDEMGNYWPCENIHAKTWKQLCEDEGIDFSC